MRIALTAVAAESAEHGEPLIHPFIVGGVALAILLALLLVLISVGGGREHS